MYEEQFQCVCVSHQQETLILAKCPAVPLSLDIIYSSVAAQLTLQGFSPTGAERGTLPGPERGKTE